MTKNGERIIDGLAGLSREFTDELNELHAELYDKFGNAVEPTPENIHELMSKANRHAQLLQIRNSFWAATLN